MRLIRSVALAVGLVVGLIAVPLPRAHAQLIIGVSIDVAPPPLPVYEQPIIPEPGYIWVPGYWAWSDDVGYYWVPGTWVLPPEPELLWTPGYWGWNDGAYVFFPGYWGTQVGYYGGVYYGYGYNGLGYEGGYWRDGRFFYNSTVNNFGGVQIVNVYSKTVIVNNPSRVSFNGGAGGTTARPTPEQLAFARERHVPPTAAQEHHVEAAAKDPSLSLAHNQGHPAVAATAHSGEFKGPGVVAAHPGPPAPVRPAKVVRPAGHETTLQSNEPGRETPERKGVVPHTTTGPGPTEKKPPTTEAKRPEREMVRPVKPTPPANEKRLPPPAASRLETHAKPAAPPPHAPPPQHVQTARPASAPHAPPRAAPVQKPKCKPGQRCG